MSNKKVSIIGIVGVPACYGGFETLVENLIVTDKIQFTIYCSSLYYPNKLKQYKSAKLVYFPIKANGIQSIFYDIICLGHTLFTRPDTILILGVSGSIFLPLYRLFSKSKIVVNPDGLEWRREKWGKSTRRFLKLSERLLVKYSDVIISDNQSISDYIFIEYSATSKLITYGGDHAIASRLCDINKGYALSICRIEPENNVGLILEAFSQTKTRIIFVGNWLNSKYGRALRKKYANFDNINLIEPIYDINELFKLRSECSFYIHGHSAGGTNPSLIEMMHFSKPIYCFDCIYNRATTEGKAHFFSSTKQLAEIVRGSIDDNGTIMKRIAEKRYTWSLIRNKYLDIFLGS